MYKSGYWRKVSIAEWFNRLDSVSRKLNGKRFSIVYRFYSTFDGWVRYVGRSDSPVVRANSHWSLIGPYSMHVGLGGQVSWVDFCYIVGKGRCRAAYE